MKFRYGIIVFLVLTTSCLKGPEGFQGDYDIIHSVERYECEAGNCVESENGFFESLSECQTNCP